MSKLVVVDDDRSVIQLVRKAFEQSDIEVHWANTAAAGLALIAEQKPDVVLLDIMLQDKSGLETFSEVRQFDSKLPVIFITASGKSDTAIEAMKLGAYDFVPKPLAVARIREVVGQALDLRRMISVLVALPDKGVTDEKAELLVGQSPSMLAVYKGIAQVAPQDVTVLIRGESGTGKELIARAIYQHSGRSAGPFLAVNCAAIPDALLESELFGHEKGSFTSADSKRIGKFEQCNGGTIFLDEVGDMSQLVHGKLLRILQEQRFERMGGNETIHTNVRIIAATNRDLEHMTGESTFRPDLYYRLNGFTIKLPPLRDRGGDILLLLERFLNLYNRQLKKQIEGISPEALKLLLEYSWPGNVRELQSLLKKAILQTNGPIIVPEFLPEEILAKSTFDANHADKGGPSGDLAALLDERLQMKTTNLYAESLELMERHLVTRVLRESAGNQSKAAGILGITRGSLRRKMQDLGITINQDVSVEEE